jgi:UDP-GlcNAc:undecaprenyl-phosphate/decaprenyl-phosphate GlcNAc-1-phosphate transferase
MGMIYLALFTGSMLISLLLTRLVRNLALRRGWVADPSSHHTHCGLIPRIGGIAIFTSFVTVTCTLVLASSASGIDIGLNSRTIFYILLPGALIFLLGLYDDIYSANPRVKILFQVIAGAMLYGAGIGKFGLPSLLGLGDLAWLSLPLTIFWVLWITNAFNLIDGLDGLAAGSSLLSTLTVFAVCLISGNAQISLLAVVLAGATMGFLRFNFNPASIFLGDSGSLFLGFTLSALALAGSEKTPTIVAVALPVVSFGLPLLETLLSVIRRYLSGRPLFSADREHIHHKLLERGHTHRQAVIILYGASALCGLLSLFLLQPGSGAVAIVLFTLGICVWMGVKRLGYYELDELGRAAQRTMDQRRVIANNLAIRRAGNKLAEARNFLQICCILQEEFEVNDFDGFQLNLANVPAEYPLHEEFWFFAQDRKDEHRYAWYKPAQDNDSDQTFWHKWALTLELETTSRHRFGCFTLYRSQSDKPLMVDLELLTSDFTRSLADAVERLMKHSREDAESITTEVGRQGLTSALTSGRQPAASYGFESA